MYKIISGTGAAVGDSVGIAVVLVVMATVVTAEEVAADGAIGVGVCPAVVGAVVAIVVIATIVVDADDMVVVLVVTSHAHVQTVPGVMAGAPGTPGAIQSSCRLPPP